MVSILCQRQVFFYLVTLYAEELYFVFGCWSADNDLFIYTFIFTYVCTGSSSHRGSISQIINAGGSTPPGARDIARRLRMRMAAGSQSQSGKKFWTVENVTKARMDLREMQQFNPDMSRFHALTRMYAGWLDLG